MVVKVTFNQGWFPDSGRMARATQTNLPKSLQWFCLLPPSPLRGQCRIFTDFPILLHCRHLSRIRVLYFATSVKTKVDILYTECAKLHDIANTTPLTRHCSHHRHRIDGRAEHVGACGHFTPIDGHSHRHHRFDRLKSPP